MMSNISNYYGTGRGSNATSLEIVGRFFYISSPWKDRYKDIKDVPDYVVDVSWCP